jgi:hypothetical protein
VGAQVGAQVRDQVGAQVRDQVGAQVGAQVRDQVGAQVRAQVRDQVGAQVWAQVRAQVWAQVGAQVRDQVGAQVRDQVGAQKLETFSFASYGSIYDYGWVSFFDFFTQIGIINHKGFNEFQELISSGIYDMIRLNGFCIVSSLPTKISRNPENQLHSSEGAAIEFKDGYKQYYLNGRNIPDWVFEEYESKTLTVDKFNKEDNEDIRAGIITLIKEREGAEGLMKFLGSTCIDEQIVVHSGGYTETLRLYRTDKKFPELQNSKGEFDQSAAWIEMKCPSTGQTYLIDTCPTFNNAVECAKWHRPKVVTSDIPYIWESAN